MHVVNLDIPQHGSLDATVRKIKARPFAIYFFFLYAMIFSAMVFSATLFSATLFSAMRPAVAVLNLRRRKLHGSRVAMRSQPVDDRASGIAQSNQLRDLGEGFAGSVVASMSAVFVRPTL